ncbi:hypothetical protein B6I74_17275 [Klebsiella variicola]|uniref:hypothetical protein n=1 Tax=Klebsiella variicola TaxID=244366 RepID=UPI000C7DEEB1|nr:hypothetical protein [Klebsiella variicola]PLE59135.1 hypothetical protein B6I74_17275 [Klebsiella variicola]
MKIKNKVKGLRETITYINKEGRQLKSDFQNELITQSRALAIKMQTDLDNSIDKGGVSFTSKAIYFKFSKRNKGVTCYIGVKDIQNNYLYEIINKPASVEKFVNTSAAPLTKQGNIARLRANIKSKKYKVVESGGKKRLIDTTKKDTKTKTKRVIGIQESKKRKMIYDFYNEGEKGVRMIVSTIQGHFSVKKGR